jgi:hypothetical protein
VGHQSPSVDPELAEALALARPIRPVSVTSELIKAFRQSVAEVAMSDDELAMGGEVPGARGRGEGFRNERSKSR